MLSLEQVHQTLYSLIRTEYCAHFGLTNNEFQWPLYDGELRVDSHGLAFDSLLRMQVVSQAMDMFGLHDSAIGDKLLIEQSLSDWSQLVCKFQDGDTVLFRSSGTTGQPRGSRHLARDLLGEAAGFAEILSARGVVRRCVLLAPSHHIYGYIWGVLLPKIMGVPVVAFDESIKAVHGNLKEGDIVVALPTWWQYLLNGNRFPPGVRGVSSTQSLSGETWEGLLLRGLSGLLEVYGSSETAGIGYREQPWAELRLLSRWSAQGRCEPDELLEKTSGKLFEVPDRLRFESGERFRLNGRRDRKVQVAGHNVSTQEIAGRLAEHPDVVDVQVRLMRPGEGDRLKAIVVCRDAGGSRQRALLREWCRRRFLSYELPKLTFADSMPVNSMGKIGDW